MVSSVDIHICLYVAQLLNLFICRAEAIMKFGTVANSTGTLIALSLACDVTGSAGKRLWMVCRHDGLELLLAMVFVVYCCYA